jgi:predicted Zn finger-like uncharacterized protein
VKFSCSKCETKYSIADEKVRGKVLKIRCKKCENIIVVREPKPGEAHAEAAVRSVDSDPRPQPQEPISASEAAGRPAAGPGSPAAVLAKQAPVESTGDAAATRVVPQNEMEGFLKRGGIQAPATRGSMALAADRSRPAPAAPAPVQQLPTPEWFLASRGQQLGPFSVADIQSKYAGGEIDDRTYGWRDGMADWKRLPDIPDLKPVLLKPAALAPPPPLPPPPPPMTTDGYGGGAEVVDLQAARRQRSRQTSEDIPDRAPPVTLTAMPRPDVANDPLGAMLIDAAASLDGSAPLEGAAPLAGNAQDPFASVPDAGSGADGPPRESTRMFIAAAGLTNRGKKHKMYALSGFGMTAAFATVLYLDYAGIYQIPIVTGLVNIAAVAFDVERPPPKQRLVDDDEADFDIKGLFGKKEGKRRAKPRPGPGQTSEVDLAAALAGAQAGDGTLLVERKNDSTAQEVEVQSNAQTSEALKNLLIADGRSNKIDIRLKGAPAADAQAAKTANPDAVPLTPEQIFKVVQDQQSSLRDCANSSAKAGEKFKGTVVVTVTIGPSGKVKQAVASDLKIRDMELGSCIGRALSRWMFPRFQGEPFDVELPLKMAVGK